MVDRMARVRCLLFVAVMCIVVVTVAPAFAFNWTVSRGLPFDKCFIDTKNGSTELKAGQSFTFQMDSFVMGRCHPPAYLFNVKLMSRTCDGKDWTSSITPAPCTQDIRLKICAKVSNPFYGADYHYGFCPE